MWLCRTKVYQVWQAMRQRVLNPKNDRFKDYGGRGIKICKRWNSFTNFVKDMGPRPRGWTLERKNNDGNYEPSNCRWASQKTQASNRRDNWPVTFKGKSQNLAQWAIEVKIKRTTLFMRLKKYGWSVEKALTTQPQKQK